MRRTVFVHDWTCGSALRQPFPGAWLERLYHLGRPRVTPYALCMPQLSALTQEFAHLVWLLVHRPRETDEQKESLRRLLEARSQPFVVVLTDVSVSVAEAASMEDPPAELPWLAELSVRMAGHSVRAIGVQGDADAGDLLSIARAVAETPTPGDEGANFDKRVVSLALASIEVFMGREGFVRRATPPIGNRPVPTPASSRTPAFGAASLGYPRPMAVTPQSIRATAPPARHVSEAAPDPTLEQQHERDRDGTLRDDTSRIMETSMSLPSGVPALLHELLRRVDRELTPDSAAQILESVARAAEEAAKDGDWVEVAQIMSRLHGRSDRERDGELKRAILLTFRRLENPRILSGIAQLLPKQRELRESITMILSRAGDEGSDVLIDLLISEDSAADRRSYRMALSECPTAIPALIHLLGDSRWYVVRNAAGLLGELGATQADEKLGAVMRHADVRVRRAAAGALARLATARAVHALLLGLSDESPAVRLQSALGIGSIRNPRAVQDLIAALDAEDDADVQGAILGALGALPTTAAIERLSRAARSGSFLQRQSKAYRLQALQALADAGTHAATAALRSFSTDRDKDVRERVERLLMQRAQAG